MISQETPRALGFEFFMLSQNCIVVAGKVRVCGTFKDLVSPKRKMCS